MKKLEIREANTTEITYEIDQFLTNKCWIDFKQGENSASFLAYKYGDGSYSLESFRCGKVDNSSFTQYDSSVDTLRFRGRGRGRKPEAAIKNMQQFIKDCQDLLDTVLGEAEVAVEEVEETGLVITGNVAVKINGGTYVIALEDLDQYADLEDDVTFLLTLKVDQVDDLILKSGRIVKTLEKYRPEDGSPGYDIITVEVDGADQLVLRGTGGDYKPSSIEDGFITVWQPIKEEVRK